MKNTLYYGDNLDILGRHIKDENIDFLYLAFRVFYFYYTNSDFIIPTPSNNFLFSSSILICDRL